jgi:hypothetical protein
MHAACSQTKSQSGWWQNLSLAMFNKGSPDSTNDVRDQSTAKFVWVGYNKSFADIEINFVFSSMALLALSIRGRLVYAAFKSSFAFHDPVRISGWPNHFLPNAACVV